MWINVTWNYGVWYRKDYAFGKDGIRTIYGMTGAESIPFLRRAIDGMKESEEELTRAEITDYIQDEGEGYRMPIKENAIEPLHQLLAFAQLRHDGVWRGD